MVGRSAEGGNTTQVLTTDGATGGLLGRLTWRGLVARDLPGLIGLYARSLTDDGGQPFAGDDWLLHRWYIDAEDSAAAFDGDRLIGASAWRYVSADGQRRMAIVGQVAPEWRRRGIGARLLDIALDSADPRASVVVETESLTVGADSLYRSRGLTCVFAEDVMAISLADGLPDVASRADVVFSEWSAQAIARFFAVYQASFRTRPGFPNPTVDEWVKWITNGEDFRPDWSLLATVDGVDVGFIASDRGGWISQVGVVPKARGQAIAVTLIIEVLRRMAAHGERSAVLNVGVNNPEAIALYRRLGFGPVGRRARYEPARLSAPWQPR